MQIDGFNYFFYNHLENGGNTNTESNLRLRTAIESAIKKGVLKTTIQMALKKLKENPDASQLQRHIFECRVYNKVFMIAVYYTVNWGLTKSLVGNAFRRHNAEIIKTTHLFDEKGYINGIVRSGVNTENMQDDCETDAIETGANEVYIEDVADRQVTFYCEPQVPYINGVRQQLEKLGYKIEESGISYEPHNLVAINVKEQLDYTKFREKLEAIDGFDELFDNIEDDE